MTTARTMSETEGDLGEWSRCSRPCPKCGSTEFYWTTWDSSCGGYTDEKQECRACGYYLWIDGPDA